MTTQALFQTGGCGALALVLRALMLLISLLLSATLVAAQESGPKPADQPEADAQVEKEKDATKQPILAKGIPVAAANLTRAFQPVPGTPSPPGTGAVAGEWFMEWSYSVNNTDVRGNRDRSFLHEGVNNLAEYTFLHKRPIWDIRKLEAMGLFRYTDDPRIDPEVNSVQRTYLRLSGPTFETDPQVIRKRGRWVIYGFSGGRAVLDTAKFGYDGITVMPFSSIAWMGTPEHREGLAFVQGWLETEELLDPTVYPLARAAEAELALEQGRTVGKVVLAMQER